MQENWEIHWKDYYRILQVHPAAEQEVIKGAYDRLARKYHPDLNKSPTAVTRMKEINEAFEVLGDLERRRRYHPAWLQRNETIRTTTESDQRAREAEKRAQREDDQASQHSKTGNAGATRPKDTTTRESIKLFRRTPTWAKWLVGLATFGIITFVILPNLPFVSKPVSDNESTQTSSPTAASNLIPTTPPPSIRIYPISGTSPGSSVSIFGYNFTPYATVKSSYVLFRGLPCTNSTTANIDGYGEFILKVVISDYLWLGDTNVTVTDSSGKSATTSFTVTSPRTTEIPGIATIYLSPTSGSPGSWIMIYGYSFTSYGTVKSSDILCGGIPCEGSDVFTANSFGDVLLAIPISANEPPGAISVIVTDSSGKSASTTFKVTTPLTATQIPTITLTPTSGSPGSIITIKGSNFTPYGTVTMSDVLLNGLPYVGSTVQIDSSGKFSVTAVIPTAESPGTMVFAVRDSSNKSAVMAFMVH